MVEGRYKYIDKIGKGAFGTVLLMEDTVVDERLILKFLNPNVAEDEEVMKRFVHELRYSRKITHQNVIRIYDFLFIQGNYAISMEYFPSHTLGAEIVNEKPVRAQARDPLRHRHVHGHDRGAPGRHRASRPQAGQHPDQRPGLLKIVDFGVAAAHREGDTQLTKTGYVIGSPEIHGARTDPGQEGRRTRRRVRHRRHDVRDAHRRAPLCPRRSHGRDVPARAGPRAAAARDQPGADRRN